MPGEMPTYPKRPKFFANHFVRVMAKACLANDVGPEACWLITVIALTEDAKGYRDSVTFFNEQLLPLTGLKNVKALDRIRGKAVESGWLVYLPGGKSKAGRYWVEIPTAHRNWDDAPTDEKTVCTDYSRSISTKEAGEKREESGEESGREAGEKREESGQHSSLSQDSLILSQEPPTPGRPEVRVFDPEGEPRSSKPPKPEQVVEHWNAQPSLMRITSTDVNRERAIRSLGMDSQWVENWRGVIEFMGRARKYSGDLDGWRPPLNWLFKGSNFATVLDEMRNEGTGPVPQARSPTGGRRTVGDVLAAHRAKQQQQPPTEGAA